MNPSIQNDYIRAEWQDSDGSFRLITTATHHVFVPFGRLSQPGGEGTVVDLDDVDRCARGDRSTRFALPAGLSRGSRCAVERLGEDPRQRGFTHPADTTENEGVGDSVQLDGVGQGLRHMTLTDHLRELGRAPFTG